MAPTLHAPVTTRHSARNDAIAKITTNSAVTGVSVGRKSSGKSET